MPLAIFIGVLLGIVAGLMPGIHPNNLIFVLPLLTLYFDPLFAAVVIVSASIVNIFVNFIPTIFLGAPDESTTLATLPGHKMLLVGSGYEAVKLSVTGGFFGVLLSIITLPLFVIIIPIIYTTIRQYLHIILSVIVLHMILREKGHKKIFAFVVFLLSGLLGYYSLSFSDSLIFPLLTGLFGLPTLVLSTNDNVKIPKQTENNEWNIKYNTMLSSVSTGSIAGVIAGLLPGLGASQATMLAQQVLKHDNDEKKFLMSIGSVATSDSVYSLMALYIIGNPRSGIAVAVSEIVNINLNTILILLVAIIASAGIGVCISLFLAKKFSNLIRYVNYSKISSAILVFLFALIFALSGTIGFLIAVIALSIGFVASLTHVNRSHAMGCLIFSTILWFSGISIF